MRKTRAWYKKVAFYLVQVALCNSFVLFWSAGNTGKFQQFYEAVLKDLIFSDQERAGRSTSGTGGARIVPGQHFPGVVPHTGKKGRSPKKSAECVTGRGYGRTPPLSVTRATIIRGSALTVASGSTTLP